MTVKELAAALAALPEELQGLAVVFQEEGDQVMVMTVQHAVSDVMDHEWPCVKLAGYVRGEDSSVLYREGDAVRAAQFVNAPACPRCGATMQGGAPHGPWPIQWECRACGNVVIPPTGGT